MFQTLHEISKNLVFVWKYVWKYVNINVSDITWKKKKKKNGTVNLVNFPSQEMFNMVRMRPLFVLPHTSLIMEQNSAIVWTPMVNYKVLAVKWKWWKYFTPQILSGNIGRIFTTNKKCAYLPRLTLFCLCFHRLEKTQHF